MGVEFFFFFFIYSEISNVVITKFTFYFSFSIVVEWGDDVKAVSEDEAMVLVNHQATGDVCTLMMCLQDKGTVGYNWGMGSFCLQFVTLGLPVSVCGADDLLSFVC